MNFRELGNPNRQMPWWAIALIIGFILLGLVICLSSCGAGGGSSGSDNNSPPVQQYGSVQGTVTDGRVFVQGVLVQVVGYHELQATTNDVGFFRIDNIPVGWKTLRFFKDGYTSTDRDVEIQADTVIPVPAVNLSPSRPQLDSIDPVRGPVGTIVALTGLGFGTNQRTSVVTFGGATSDSYTSWTDTQIVCEVPDAATTGVVRVIAAGVQSTKNVIFTVESPPPLPPSISAIAPTSGKVGDSITITGSNFGATRGTSVVTFGSLASDSYTSWNDDQIVCTVPDITAPQTYGVTVTTTAGTSNSGDFTVVAVYHKLVFSRVLVEDISQYGENPPLSGAFGIAVANNNGILTYLVVSGTRIATFASDGTFIGVTTNFYPNLFGIGYLNGKVYASGETSSKIWRFNFNPTTRKVEEPPEIEISWGWQLKHIHTTSNFIYVASTGTGLIGKFDTNLQTPPVSTWDPGFGPCGFCTNQNESIGWAPDTDGTVVEINLLNGQTTQWPNPVGQYAWQVARYQNTLFFIPQNPACIEYYKLDGTFLGKNEEHPWSPEKPWSPSGIYIYTNPLNGKIEATVTIDYYNTDNIHKAGVVIYEVQEIVP